MLFNCTKKVPSNIALFSLYLLIYVIYYINMSHVSSIIIKIKIFYQL